MTLLLAILSTVAFQDDPAALIEKLRSESLEVREAAAKKLKELGVAARPALEKAEKDADGEVSTRAAYLLRILKLKEELTLNLQKAIPDVADRLASGNDAAWTAVLIEATARDDKDNRKYPALLREDLMPLAVRAVRGAEKIQDRRMLTFVAAAWRLTSARPEIEKWLEDPDVEVRRAAIYGYAGLGGSAVAGRLAELLKDSDILVRRAAAGQLGSLDARQHIKQLVAVLNDDDQVVRVNALESLGLLGDRSVIPAVAPLLDTLYRGPAAVCLARLRSAEHTDKIVAALDHAPARRWALNALHFLDSRDRSDIVAKFLDDEDENVRVWAMALLCSWDVKAGIKRIGPWLQDPDTRIRISALIEAGRLGESAWVKEVSALLKDPISTVRGRAAETLERLNALDRISEIALLLKDDDPYPRWNAALAVGRLVSKLANKDRTPWIQALRALENDPSEYVRFAAAASVLRLGTADETKQRALLVQVDSMWSQFRFVIGFECCSALTQRYEKNGFDKLNLTITLKRSIESIDDLSAVMAETGLVLKEKENLILKGRKGPGHTLSLLDLLSDMLEPWPGVIVEKDSVRVVPRDEAVAHWLKRLQGK